MVHAVNDSHWGKGIALEQAGEPLPRQPSAVPATTQPFAPSPPHLVAESSYRLGVAGEAVVGIVTSQLAAQRRVLLAQSPVPMRPAPLPHRSHRPAEPVLRRLALDHPASLPGTPPIVREPQHREAVLALRTAPRRLRRPAKLHHPRLLRVQPQPVLPKPLRQHPKHPPRIVFPLEDQHGIVSISDLKGPPPKPRLDLVLEPLIQYLVQVDVR